MKKSAHLLLTILLALSLGSCGKEQAPKKPLEKAKPAVVREDKREGAEVQPASQEEYKYDVRGRRGPFPFSHRNNKKETRKEERGEPLESYELDEIKLLAIAWNKNKKYYALILLPDKKTYTITEGMTMGLQGGRVEKITSNTVVIREYIKDYKGEIKPRDSVLKLHKGEEE